MTIACLLKNTVEAARLSIETLKAIYRALDDLDMPALRDAQARQQGVGGEVLCFVA